MARIKPLDLSPSLELRKKQARRDKLSNTMTAIFEANARNDSVKLRGAEVILNSTKDLTDPAEFDNALEALGKLSVSTGAAKSVIGAYQTAIGQEKQSAVANNFIYDSMQNTEKELKALYTGGQFQTSEALEILDGLKETSSKFRGKANKRMRKALDSELTNLSNTIALAEMFAGVDKDVNEPGIQHYNQDIKTGWAHFLAGDLKRATTRLDAGKKKTSEDNWAKWEDKYARDRASLDDLFNKHIKDGTQSELYSSLKPLLPTQKLKLHSDTLASEQERLTSALNKILEKSDIENKQAKIDYKSAGVTGFVTAMSAEATKDKINLDDPIALAEWLTNEMDMPGADLFGSESEDAGGEIMAALMQSYLTLDNAWDELSGASGSMNTGTSNSGLFD